MEKLDETENIESRIRISIGRHIVFKSLQRFLLTGFSFIALLKKGLVLILIRVHWLPSKTGQDSPGSTVS